VSSPARLFPVYFRTHQRGCARLEFDSEFSGEIEKAGLETDDDEDAMLRLQETRYPIARVSYRRYARIVYSIALAYCETQRKPEDAVHEIFLCIYPKVRVVLIRQRGKPRSWKLVRVQVLRLGRDN